MANPNTPNTPRPKNYIKDEPDTPPSAKSAGSNDTSSSGGTASTVSSSKSYNATLPAAAEGTPASFPVPLPAAAEGTEGEEEEELDQEGLPEEIKKKTYLGEDGELELIKDLEDNNLSDLLIDISESGKAHRRKMPTKMHRKAVAAIEESVTSARPPHAAPLLHTETAYEMKVGRQGKKKLPDLAVWGKDRLNEEKLPRRKIAKTLTIPGVGVESLNPNVIFEFSWSNDLEIEEIPKFNRQMNGHIEELGKVNLGFLIKTIPAIDTGKKLKLSREADPGEIPVCGFDVYRARAGESVRASERFLEYRIGVNESDFITIPGDDLGDGYSDIEIPLHEICEELIELGVKFMKKAE